MKKVCFIAIGVAIAFVVFVAGYFVGDAAAIGRVNEQTSANVSSESAQPKVGQTPKIYQQGEEAFILDDSGAKMYSIRFNGARVANDFIYKSDFSPATTEVIELDYTYTNIAKSDGSMLTIQTGNILVADITGAVAESSDMYSGQLPQSITAGTNCTVQGYYGLSNKSDKIRISFSSEAFKKSGILAFEIPVN